MIEHFPDPCGASCVARGSVTDTVDGREHDGCMEATTRFTAPELVALANRAAHEAPRGAESIEGSDLAIRASDGAWYFERTDSDSPWPLVMRVTLTRENTASEDALVRALLASAVTIRNHGLQVHGGISYGGYEARLADAPTAYGYATEAKARDALLDALLPSGRCDRCGHSAHAAEDDECGTIMGGHSEPNYCGCPGSYAEVLTCPGDERRRETEKRLDALLAPTEGR